MAIKKNKALSNIKTNDLKYSNECLRVSQRYIFSVGLKIMRQKKATNFCRWP